MYAVLLLFWCEGVEVVNVNYALSMFFSFVFVEVGINIYWAFYFSSSFFLNLFSRIRV